MDHRFTATAFWNGVSGCEHHRKKKHQCIFAVAILLLCVRFPAHVCTSATATTIFHTGGSGRYETWMIVPFPSAAVTLARGDIITPGAPRSLSVRVTKPYTMNIGGRF